MLPAVDAEIPIELTLRKRVISKPKHAAQFAVERLYPTENGGSELAAIHRDYREWCSTKDIEPLPAAQIGLLLAELFDGAGLSIAEEGGCLVAVGVSLKEQSQALGSGLIPRKEADRNQDLAGSLAE